MRRSVNRGGNYNNSANGFGSFNANNPRSNQNGNIGFRSASPALLSGHDVGRSRASVPNRAGKGICILGRHNVGRKIRMAAFRAS